jgi:regulatory protein
MDSENKEPVKPMKKAAQPSAKPATAARLEKGALYYLGRYASSRENLRRLLMRRVQKSAHNFDTDIDEGAEAIQCIIEKFEEMGLLNDRLYATNKVQGFHRRGLSMQVMRLRLKEKFVDDTDIEAAFEALKLDTQSPDIEAAIHYARRRRIGPYRCLRAERFGEMSESPTDDYNDELTGINHPARHEYVNRDLAALARQGFSYELAKAVVEAEDIESLEELVEDELNP